jgi:hypothetical protein
MTPQEIIQSFELYIDDQPLSSFEAYQLLTKVLNDIYNDRSWEFLRKQGNVTMTSQNTGTLPEDFVSFMRNYNGDMYNNIPEKAVVYVGSMPFDVVPMGSRMQNINKNCVYADINQGTINTTTPVSAGTILSFDYKYQPADIVETSTKIVLPKPFHRFIPQVMAIDDDVMQKMEKARSNRNENMAVYAKMLEDMVHWNARFTNI